ncbi:DNA-binding protein [Sphaerisporangium siamense]|uniref:DNA-binding protein HU-beta n=1 Tax=Sphaerisporangium siamense TaxID=795645 RepID=A0A7W7D8L6_9ACTN|nr:HU family DNA-binding protein [Sphaerisporangium siamense]MBB4702300.1 DNA-binding protein HU-beta [Sphaerisporangium siamense]GII89458.1 DNA-binding protein [Sphaerisporangium siamense]
MNKTELIAAVAERLDIHKTTAEAAVTAVLDTIRTAVASGDRVQVIGFGTWEASHKPARQGRNPSTGETIHIAESRVPRFKPGTEFKALVNKTPAAR